MKALYFLAMVFALAFCSKLDLECPTCKDAVVGSVNSSKYVDRTYQSVCFLRTLKTLYVKLNP